MSFNIDRDINNNYLFYGSTVVVQTISNKDFFRLYKNINNDKIKEAVKQIMGKKPDKIRFHDQTEEQEYEKYKIQPPQLQFQFKSGNYTLEYLNSEVLATTTSENNTDSPQNVGMNINHWITETSSLTNYIELTTGIEQSFEVGIKPLGVGGKSVTKFSFSFKQGQSITSTDTETFQYIYNSTPTVPPHSKVAVSVIANKVKLNCNIIYDVTIVGNLLVKYDDEYKDHRWYFININKIFEILKENKTLTENSKFEYIDIPSTNIAVNQI